MNPVTTSTFTHWGLRTGYALENAVRGKQETYRGTHHATFNCLPLAFTTCGDSCTAVHDLVKDLGRIKAEQSEEFLQVGEQGKVALGGRETGRLRR